MSFEPITAREALLAISVVVVKRTSNAASALAEVAKLTEAGLSRTDPRNFELTDQLADCLGEAHKLLRELNLMPPGKGQLVAASAKNEDTLARIPSVLLLPPGLEAMVERRIGPR